MSISRLQWDSNPGSEWNQGQTAYWNWRTKDVLEDFVQGAGDAYRNTWSIILVVIHIGRENALCINVNDCSSGDCMTQDILLYPLNMSNEVEQEDEVKPKGGKMKHIRTLSSLWQGSQGCLSFMNMWIVYRRNWSHIINRGKRFRTTMISIDRLWRQLEDRLEERWSECWLS